MQKEASGAMNAPSPYSDVFLGRYGSTERVAVMSMMTAHMTRCAAHLLAEGYGEQALMAIEEASAIEGAIAECRASENCGQSPI